MEMDREKDGVGYDYLVDWYINSVDSSEPVWTEGHIEELCRDFIMIPRERKG